MIFFVVQKNSAIHLSSPFSWPESDQGSCSQTQFQACQSQGTWLVARPGLISEVSPPSGYRLRLTHRQTRQQRWIVRNWKVPKKYLLDEMEDCSNVHKISTIFHSSVTNKETSIGPTGVCDQLTKTKQKRTFGHI